MRQIDILTPLIDTLEDKLQLQEEELKNTLIELKQLKKQRDAENIKR